MVFKELHSIKEAINLLHKAKIKVEVEEIDIDNSLERVSGEIVKSPEDIPPHDRSVLDGYAARWTDISMASEYSPVELKLVGEIPIDAENHYELGPGETFKVSTGSPLPKGSNVVIPKEFAQPLGDKVKVIKSFAGGYGIAVKGEDLKKGDVVLERGEIIREWHLALLASLGYRSVKVYKKIRVGVFATGNELVEPGALKKPGQVYVSTARLIVAWLNRRGLKAEYLGIVPDSEKLIENKFLKLLEKYDIVVSTGGTSVGEKDYTAKALKNLADDFVHGIALAPGKPAAFGIKEGKILMALSGMPVAALSELIAVFDPYYRKIIGREKPWEPVLNAVLGRKYTSHPGFTNVVRSILCFEEEKLKVYPLRVTGSGILSTLLKANSYFIVDEEITGIEQGESVNVRLVSENLKRCNKIELF